MPPKRVENPSINSSMLLKNLEEMDLQSSIQLSTPAQTPVPNMIGNLPDEDYPMSQPTTVRVQRPIPINPHTISGGQRAQHAEEETKEPYDSNNTFFMLNHQLQCARGFNDFAQASLQKMNMSMQGAGSTWQSTTSGEGYQEIKVYQQMAVSERTEKGSIKPTMNTFEIQLWPYVRLLDEMKCKILQTAIVVLSQRGCKICAGFGHGDTKCITALKLKFFGRKIKIIRQILKAAIGSLRPTGTDQVIGNWPLLAAFHNEAANANQVFRNKNALQESTLRAQQISLYLGDAEAELNLLQRTRCPVCYGFGHKVRETIRQDPKEKPEKQFCPTLLNIDERIEGSQLGKQEWISIKRRVSTAGTQMEDELIQTGPVVDKNAYIFSKPPTVKSNVVALSSYFVELFVVEVRCWFVGNMLQKATKMSTKKQRPIPVAVPVQVASRVCYELYGLCSQNRSALEALFNQIQAETKTSEVAKAFYAFIQSTAISATVSGQTTEIKVGNVDVSKAFAETRERFAAWIAASETNKNVQPPVNVEEFKKLMLEVDTQAISWLVSNKEYSLYHVESQVTPDKSYWRNDTEQVMAEQAMVEDG